MYLRPWNEGMAPVVHISSEAGFYLCPQSLQHSLHARYWISPNRWHKTADLEYKPQRLWLILQFQWDHQGLCLCHELRCSRW
ncbi:hypothetical protein V7174_21345, partial [Bacillus subtilis]